MKPYLCLAFLILLLLPRPALAQGGEGPFSLLWSSVESEGTRSLAWGDYDNDGDLDLAVGSAFAPVRLYRNDGGNLTPEAVWVSDETDDAASVAWGDYDNDGDLDLAVGNRYAPNRLYRNDGGTLTSSAVWASDEADDTRSLAWADYDNDGDLDLAAGNWGQQNRIYRNDGGVLTPNGIWSSVEADNTYSLAWGDYDGDGDLDLVAGNDGHPNRLYRNEGGNLNPYAAWSSVEADNTTSVAWGDYDGDGDLDLAAGNWRAPNRLYRNDGGTLTTSAVWSSAEADETFGLAWGDVDGDGDLDLAVGNGGFPLGQPNRVYRNDGGTLVLAWSSDESDATADIAWGDVNGDGTLDLAVANNYHPNRVYRNDTPALTTSAVWASAEADNTYSLAWGDCDGDGDLDLAVGNRSYQPNRLYRNEGGTLTPEAVWSSVEADDTWSIAWGDVDGDGDLDLAVGSVFAPVRLYRNDGGNLTPEAVWVSDETDDAASVAWGDYDNDGDLDLAVGNRYAPNRLYRNDGGTLTSSAVWASDEADDTRSLAWADYDNDGDLDLAAGNWGQQNRIYRNDGGVLTPNGIWSSVEADNTYSLAWGDYDGDGDLDLVAGNDGHPNRLYRNEGGNLNPYAAWSSVEADNTTSVAWGDYDGDGDLDLAAGNWRAPNRLYRNDGGTLTTSAVWSSAEADETFGLAWGDVDGDGDLDLAVGNGTVNRLYRNLRRTDAPLTDDPPYITIPRPGPTDDAFLFSTPHIITSPHITITYRLFDPEGDLVPRIFASFSPDGGGEWFSATPVTGTETDNLAASPNGTVHTFVWNAEADLIKSDTVIFRIRAQPRSDHSPILWPAVDGKSPPFRIEPPWFIRVVGEDGNPIAGVPVYADGHAITRTVAGLTVTDRAGLLNPGPLEAGTSLVALAEQMKQPTVRAGHDGWAYRIYLTNLTWDADGQAHPFVVEGAGEQRLVVRRESPLVLFNLLVSIEWDAADDYVEEIARAVRHASDYLHDLTDGQMAFGHVSIHNGGSHWADADIQISAKNTVRPHAYVGGITSDDKSHVIRIGRAWNGYGGDEGPWDAPDGYRTLAHEFGHYALYLYDEYFAYLFDEEGNLMGEVPAYCTGPENREEENDATNASVMDWQYTTSELSARDVPGLWSTLCENTAQWQLNGESCWETLTRMYTDTLTSSRWRFITPADRGAVMAGPDGLPSALPDWPEVEIHRHGPPSPPRHLTVYGPQGPYWGAIVALYKQDGRVIGQGFTDVNGRLDIYGAVEGDTVRASSFDGGLAGSVVVSTSITLTLTLEPVGGIPQAGEAGGGPASAGRPSLKRGIRSTPHLRVVAEPSPTPGRTDLSLFLLNFGPGADPFVVVTEPGGEVSYSPPLTYDLESDTYVGKIGFDAAKRGMGQVRAVGEVGGGLVRLQSTYRLQWVTADRGHDVYSNDGNLSLHLDAGSLPGEGAYLVVMPPGAVPGPLPEGLVLIGDPYDITASGALVELERPALLKLHYDGGLVRSALAPEGLGLYRWDPNGGTWQAVPASLDEERRAMVAPVTTLGTYALLASPGSWMWSHTIFLPVILK